MLPFHQSHCPVPSNSVHTQLSRAQISTMSRKSQPRKLDMFQSVLVDDAVAKKFPPGSKLVSATPHGASFWTRTARIDIILPDGRPHSYFMKVATGDVGMGMLQGEFHGATEMYKHIPSGTPRPVAWGTYHSDPGCHFYLCDFVNMIQKMPDMGKFCALLAKLHHSSMNSPEAPKQFGFPVTTYTGGIWQDVKWCDSWEESFTCQMQALIQQERESQGPSEELDRLLPAYMEKVIPRLLRPLESHGRKIKAALVHGNVSFSNIALIRNTNDPIIFDPSLVWGHNESDLGNMTHPHYRMGSSWIQEYHRHIPISAPEEDHEDRNAVYAIRAHFCALTLYPDNNQDFRKVLIADMERLVKKYPHGYQGE